jgi:hypothetical protein
MKKSGVKIKINIAPLRRLLRGIATGARNNAAHVGVLKPQADIVYESGLTMFQVAYSNEFGIPKGVGSKIPERPFIRPAYRHNNLTHIKVPNKMWAGKGAANVKEILNQYGKSLAVKISQNIIDKEEPENRPYTIALKGFDDPLTEHGTLSNSIRSEIRTNTGTKWVDK